MASAKAKRHPETVKPTSGQAESRYEKAFVPNKQIQRTFYSPERQKFATNVNAGKFMYGSPTRGQQNILNQNGQDANYHNDFMSKFGAGGGGAPNRDEYGNIVASRKPQDGATALR